MTCEARIGKIRKVYWLSRWFTKDLRGSLAKVRREDPTLLSKTFSILNQDSEYPHILVRVNGFCN
jgi:hypothetical protein